MATRKRKARSTTVDKRTYTHKKRLRAYVEGVYAQMVTTGQALREMSNSGLDETVTYDGYDINIVGVEKTVNGVELIDVIATAYPNVTDKKGDVTTDFSRPIELGVLAGDQRAVRPGSSSGQTQMMINIPLAGILPSHLMFVVEADGWDHARQIVRGRLHDLITGDEFITSVIDQVDKATISGTTTTNSGIVPPYDRFILNGSY